LKDVCYKKKKSVQFDFNRRQVTDGEYTSSYCRQTNTKKRNSWVQQSVIYDNDYMKNMSMIEILQLFIIEFSWTELMCLS